MTNMQCENFREMLQRRFDDGELLAPSFETHLDGCASCRDYAARLCALDSALSGIPLEAPQPTFELNVKTAIAHVSHDERQWRMTAAAAAIVLTISTCALSWLYPSLVAFPDLPQSIEESARRLAQFTAVPSLLDQASDLVHDVLNLRYMLQLPSGVSTWLVVAAALFTLATANGIEIIRLRTVSSTSDTMRHPHEGSKR